MYRSTIENLYFRSLVHQQEDEYRAGSYQTCAVGCSVQDLVMVGKLPPETNCDDHESLANATGTDVRLWHLIDGIFEGLPSRDRPAFPPTVFKALLDGDGNTEKAVWRWLVWLFSTNGPAGNLNQHACVAAVRDLCSRAAMGDMPMQDQWASATEGIEELSSEHQMWAMWAIGAEIRWVPVGIASSGTLYQLMRDALLKELGQT
jgi:hypothetical protein